MITDIQKDYAENSITILYYGDRPTYGEICLELKKCYEVCWLDIKSLAAEPPSEFRGLLNPGAIYIGLRNKGDIHWVA